MSRELLNGDVGKYKHQLWNKEITEEKLMQDLRDVFFMEPLVAEDVFVDVVRQYDKNFAPIPEGPERQKRTDIMKKVQDGALKYEIYRQYVGDDVNSISLELAGKARNYEASLDNMGGVITVVEY